MDKLNDFMLFPNTIKQRELEKAHYIELEKYSRKIYRREIATNLIVCLIILILIVSAGTTVLCRIF